MIESPHRLRVVDDERRENGKKLAFDAHRWVEANEDAFKLIHHFVKHQAGKGRMRDRVAVFCIQHGIRVEDEPYKFANAYWAGIARYLVVYDQSLLRDKITLADSDIDAYGLPEVSWMEEERGEEERSA